METRRCSIDAGFLDQPSRRLFRLLLRPTDRAPRGSILFLPPLAEEMHMSRRNVAMQARLLAESGFNVLLLDLTGCGDSPGEFVDASWQTWKQDATFALDSLRVLDSVPLILWGLRLGGLLACDLSEEREDIQRLLLWQPVLNGEQQIDQFLRLRTAAAAVDRITGFDRRSLWGELRSGHALEIAGYDLSPALALEVAEVRLRDLTPSCAVDWIEIFASETPEMTPPSRNLAAHWRENGVPVETMALNGEPFWRAQDAAINDTLLRATAGLLA